MINKLNIMGIIHLKINSFIHPHVVPNLKVDHVINQFSSHWSNVIDVKADVMLLYGKEERIHFNNSPFVFHVRKLQRDLVIVENCIYVSMHLHSPAKVLRYPKKHCIHLQNFCIFFTSKWSVSGNGKFHVNRWSKVFFVCLFFCKSKTLVSRQANAKFKFRILKKIYWTKAKF